MFQASLEDVSILRIQDGVFRVLATAGDTHLGGDDFDDRLIDLLADEFMERESINLRNDPFALEKLKVAAEGAKKALSVEDQVEIRIPDVIAQYGFDIVAGPCHDNLGAGSGKGGDQRVGAVDADAQNTTCSAAPAVPAGGRPPPTGATCWEAVAWIDSAATAAAASSRGTPACAVILKQASRSVSKGT